MGLSGHCPALVAATSRGLDPAPTTDAPRPGGGCQSTTIHFSSHIKDADLMLPATGKGLCWFVDYVNVLHNTKL